MSDDQAFAHPTTRCSHCAMTREQKISYGGCPLRFPEIGCPSYDSPITTKPSAATEGVDSIKEGKA